MTSVIGFVICAILNYVIISNIGDYYNEKETFISYAVIMIASELFQISTFITLGGLIHEFSKDTVKVNQNDN